MTTLGSSFNYVATAQKPTNVTHSLVASFTSPDALNLIVARCTRIEIYALEAQGLVLLHDVPLYCRVATMELWKPGNRATEQIFISTERYQFCILSYDAQRKEIVTEAKGDVADRIGRASEVGQICVMEPNMKLIGLHLYDGLFKVIPAGAGGSLMTESFNIRLEELKVIDLCFLRGLPKSTLVMLFEDNKEGRHLKTYEVNLREKDLVEVPHAPEIVGIRPEPKMEDLEDHFTHSLSRSVGMRGGFSLRHEQFAAYKDIKEGSVSNKGTGV